MSQYETVCVIKSDVQGDRLNKITDKINKILTDNKAQDLKCEDWGIRKLAYPIQKLKTAQYLKFIYNGGGPLVSELERQLSYDDSILRYMTMKLGKGDHPELKPDAYQFAKIEAESYGHPFGGGGYERRERFDRRGGGDRFDRGDRGAERGAEHSAKESREES